MSGPFNFDKSLEKSPARGKKRKSEALYDDEEETLMIEDANKKQHFEFNSQQDDSEASFDPKEEDSNLFDMVLELAKIDFSGEQKEPCPICLQNFSIAEFATHVIKCVDDLEKKDISKTDAEIAQELDQSAFIATEFEKPEFCSAGSKCKRTDAQHFITLKHPKAECPICDDQYEIYELEAHVLSCLEKPPSKQKEKSSSFSMANENTKSPTSSLSRTSSLTRSSSNPLSLQQAASMARALVEVKNKPAAEREVDLSDLLSSFNKLGFSDFMKERASEKEEKENN